MKTFFHLAVAALALGAFSSGAWAQSAAPAGDAARGKELFATDGCYQCHGYVGQGGNAGVRLGPPPIAYDAYTAQLRHPRAEMPPYEAKLLPDKDAADIYAYLQSLPKPPAVKDVPLLNNL
jgi:ubiquinol-cytochrome c reductase cytochrome c subunit